MSSATPVCIAEKRSSATPEAKEMVIDRAMNRTLGAGFHRRQVSCDEAMEIWCGSSGDARSARRFGIAWLKSKQKASPVMVKPSLCNSGFGGGRTCRRPATCRLEIETGRLRGSVGCSAPTHGDSPE
jgi:hypothetical protein